MAIRSRHLDFIEAQLGLDLRHGGFPWWLLPLAAGHTHPDALQYCKRARGGKLLLMDVRQRVFFLMVRVIGMGLDLWRLRCRDKFNFHPGSFEAQGAQGSGTGLARAMVAFHVRVARAWRGRGAFSPVPPGVAYPQGGR